MMTNELLLLTSKEYEQKIKLPLQQGHRGTLEKDFCFKKMILAIMCKQRTAAYKNLHLTLVAITQAS